MEMQQRTEEWYAIRLGKVTASRVSDVIAKTKTGYSTSRMNYAAELISERLTGKKQEKYTNSAMMHGVETEDEARASYMILTGEWVEEIAFVEHPKIKNSGASPDGLVGADGLIEIKCPNTATHLDFLKNGKPKKEYIDQMQWQMACTGRKWCDFVSYDNRLPKELAIKVLRVERNDEYIKILEEEISAFLDYIDKEVEIFKQLADGQK